MLELWLCPSRKQNTARVMQALCEKTAQRILVVPEQFSHEAERMLCRAGGDTISRFAEVLSFSRLASRVFSIEGGSACEETDAGGRLLLMALAVEQVRPRLKLFGASTSRPEFLLQLLDTLEEFRAYCLRPELLRAASEKLSGALAVKTEEFALLMESYDAACANAGQDPSSRLTRLAAALETGTFAAGRQLYLDGFTDLNGVELEILTQLLAGGAEVIVALSCDSPAGGAQIFDAARDTIRSLQRAARQAGAAVQLREFPAEDEAFSPLLRALFGRGAACPALPGVCLPCAPDIETECRAAAGEILQRMEGGARWRDIAVACADPETYRPVLETVLRRAGIPAYFAGTRDLLREPVVRMLLAALEAASGGMEQEAVLAYLKSGLSPLDAAACDALENYAVIWNIQGARWEREWTMDPAGLHGRAAPPERLAELNAWRAEAIAPLSALRRGLRAAQNTGEMVLALYHFLEQTGLREQLNERAQETYRSGSLQKAQELTQVYGIVCTVLEQLYGVLGRTVRTADAFFHIFRVVLSQYDIGTIPAQLDSVTVGSVMSLRRADVPHLLLLGANEGAFPAAAAPRSLLTDAERASLQRMGLEVGPAASARLDRELAAMASVLEAPRRSLWVSAVQERESYFFHRLTELQPQAVRGATDEALVLRAPQAYLERWLPAAGGLLQEPMFAGAAARAEQARTYSPGSLRPETARALYGAELHFSSSRIDVLAGCRFAHFLQYGLRAQEREPAEFDSRFYGTFVHDVLEYIVQQTEREGGFAAVPRSRVQELAQERMEQNAQTLLETFPDSGRTGYLLRRTFDEVTQVVDELYDELSVSAFRPEFCELEFSARGALPGVAFAGERCRGVVEGFVDRVDVWQSGGRPYVRVVDYKTGKKSFDYTNVLHGRGLQMLLYLFALVRQGGHLLHGEPLPAGVLYFPARIERVSVRDRLAQAEIEKERCKQLRRSGVLLNSDPVLEAMEPCGGSPRFLPYTLDKEGRKTGDLASFAQLSQLERFVFRTVAALGDELADGRIDPDPCIRDAKDSACAFCPYSEVCAGHEQPRWLKKITAEEFWQTLERREHG